MIDLNPLLLARVNQYRSYSSEDYFHKIVYILDLHAYLSPQGIASLDLHKLYEEHPHSKDVLEKVTELYLMKAYCSAMEGKKEAIDKIKRSFNLCLGSVDKQFVIHWLENYKINGAPYKQSLLSFLTKPDQGNIEKAMIDLLLDIFLPHHLIPQESLRLIFLSTLKKLKKTSVDMVGDDSGVYLARAQKLIRYDNTLEYVRDAEGNGIHTHGTKEFREWLATEKTTPKVLLPAYQPEENDSVLVEDFPDLNPGEQAVAKILLCNEFTLNEKNNLISRMAAVFRDAEIKQTHPLRLEKLAEINDLSKIFHQEHIYWAMSNILSFFTVDDSVRNEGDGLVGPIEDDSKKKLQINLETALNKSPDDFSDYYGRIKKLFSDNLIQELFFMDLEDGKTFLFKEVLKTGNALVVVDFIQSFKDENMRVELIRQSFDVILDYLRNNILFKEMTENMHFTLARCQDMLAEKSDVVVESVDKHLCYCFKNENWVAFKSCLNTLSPDLKQSVVAVFFKRLAEQLLNPRSGGYYPLSSEGQDILITFLEDNTLNVRMKTNSKNPNSPQTLLEYAFRERYSKLFKKLVEHDSMDRATAWDALKKILEVGKEAFKKSGFFDDKMAICKAYIKPIVEIFSDLQLEVAKHAARHKNEPWGRELSAWLSQQQTSTVNAEKSLAKKPATQELMPARSSPPKETQSTVQTFGYPAPPQPTAYPKQKDGIEKRDIPAADTSGADAFLQNALARGARESEASSSSPARLLSTSHGSPLRAPSPTPEEKQKALLAGAPSVPTDTLVPRRVMRYNPATEAAGL